MISSFFGVQLYKATIYIYIYLYIDFFLVQPPTKATHLRFIGSSGASRAWMQCFLQDFVSHVTANLLHSVARDGEGKGCGWPTSSTSSIISVELQSDSFAEYACFESYV